MGNDKGWQVRARKYLVVVFLFVELSLWGDGDCGNFVMRCFGRK